MDLTTQNQDLATTTHYVGIENNTLKLYNRYERFAYKGLHKIGKYAHISFKPNEVGIALLRLIKSDSTYDQGILKAQGCESFTPFISEEYSISDSGAIMQAHQQELAEQTARRTLEVPEEKSATTIVEEIQAHRAARKAIKAQSTRLVPAQ